MNLLLIVLIIVLLFYVCRCAKEQFDNSLYLGYGGEPQFRDMTEDFGSYKPKPEISPLLKMEQKRREDELKSGYLTDCLTERGAKWCRKNWIGY
jgi:hypothetical protein